MGRSETRQSFIAKSCFPTGLPWASSENDGKGPFEASLFQAPDFTIVHALACCASVVWDGVNLPNYSDIRETCGLKNIQFWNRMAIRVESHPLSRHVHPSEAKPLKASTQMVNFVTASIHELIGHGSGKLLSETAPNVYNFNKDRPPTNPLTGQAVESWYKPGQTWTSVFGKLAITVEECRANLISYYLADEKEVLRLFVLEDEASIPDCQCNTSPSCSNSSPRYPLILNVSHPLCVPDDRDQGHRRPRLV
ncbi:peptidase family M49-domain-containing protein [Dichotomopilus funicola]|uniref:Peptidase family M49-domain-containing protein n=1 Tax=Dichotomopilus funicola TaxID=1934379 RepID=A0AAN6UZE2_9PEZI|nr:peptidase family M49-domain-containing protein [Dichotomopilus funicola]